MANKTFGLTDTVYSYLLSASLREPQILSRLRRETAKLPDSRMQIAPEQGQFMALLTKLMGAKKCIEIGVFTGYSSLCVALTLPQDGKIIACDVSEEWTQIARRYWKEAGVTEKIELCLQPALKTLDKLLEENQSGTFDFAFIDADKENYTAYYERCLKLLRRGGLIAIDNTLWSGRVAEPANRETDTVAIREFNSKLHLDQRVALSLLPIADGLTLALKL
ncbi:MAG TPA: class I SAM-dependent methyltransferase [Burkholderiales bacterium]|nr:class I SAM-dependent methyltransferase [Burkholderiales bacterium]